MNEKSSDEKDFTVLENLSSDNYMVTQKIAPFLTSELDHSLSILVNEEIFETVSTQIGKSRFTSVTTPKGFTFPITVQKSNIESCRMGMTLRTLSDCKVGETVCLRKPDLTEGIFARQKDTTRRIFFIYWVHKLDSFFEMFLAKSLGAPQRALRTSQTYPGDDERSVVRLPVSLFPMLGLLPKDQVIVEWAGKKTLAFAFEDFSEEASSRISHIQKTQAVGKNTHQIPDDFPTYLLIRLSPQVRDELGISKDNVSTIITVKRRIRTQLVSEFNKLLMSLCVLALSVSTTHLSGLTKWIITVILVPLIVIVSLAPLKIRKLPKGIWP